MDPMATLEKPSAERGADTVLRLAKVAGVFAVCASAVSQEYGSGINFVLVNTLGKYPDVKWLVPIAMLAAGIVLIPKVALFARLSSVAPRAGSTYVWLSRTVGLPVGFVVAFLWFIGVTAAMGFLAFSSSTFVGAFLDSVGVNGAWTTTPAGHLLVGLAAIWIIFAIHYFGVRGYATLVSIVFWLVLIAAGLTIGYGFATPQTAFLAKVGPLIHAAPPSRSAPSPASFVSVITLLLFAYGGLTAATSLGGEARDATRTMPRGIVSGFLTALILYTAIAFALFHAVPYWTVGPLIAAKHRELVTTPGLIGLIAPHAVSAFLNLLVALIVLKTIAPEMLDGSRYLYAWGQDGLLPDAFRRTSRFKTPHVALITVALLGSLFLIEATFGGWSIGVTLRSISLVLVFGVLGVGIYNLRFGSARRSELSRVLSLHPDVLVWAPLAIIVAAVLIASVIVVPKTVWWLQPSFQGLIAVLIAIGIYRAAAGRDRAIAARAAAHVTAE
jgi:amino acid transporter